MLVDQVPAAFERVRREIALARFLGKLAVDQGVRELRSRLDDLATAAAPATEATPVESVPEPTTAQSDRPGVDTLALADYDHLPASDIVAKLEGLEPDERDAIERYELAGRCRRTVLGKLDQLRAAP